MRHASPTCQSTVALVLVLGLAACTAPAAGSSSPSDDARLATSRPSSPAVASPSPSPTIAATPEPTLASSSPTASPSSSVDPGASGEAPSASPATELARRLPTDIDGTAYVVSSFEIDVRDDVAGGDICSIYCPGEISDYARGLGVEAGAVEVAWAVPADPDPTSGAAIRAIRVPGAKERRLVKAWLEHGDTTPYPPFPIVRSIEIGGKRPTLIVLGPLPSLFNVAWAYPNGDTLYLVHVFPEPDDPLDPPPHVAAALSALP